MERQSTSPTLRQHGALWQSENGHIEQLCCKHGFNKCPQTPRGTSLLFFEAPKRRGSKMNNLASRKMGVILALAIRNALFMWGFDHKFTSYIFRNNCWLVCLFKQMLPEERWNSMCLFDSQCLFEIIVGEIIVKSRYKLNLPRGSQMSRLLLRRRRQGGGFRSGGSGLSDQAVARLGGGRVLPTEIPLPQIGRLASNCSTGSCLYDVNKRISSKKSNS